MVIFYCVFALLMGGAFLSLFWGRKERALKAASWAVAGASTLGFFFAFVPLLTGTRMEATLPIPLPLGSCTLGIDPLSSIFLLPVFFLSGIGGILLPSRVHALEAFGRNEPIHYGRHGFFFCLLVASMTLVLTASDTILFLVAWEVMSLAPFFLISPQDKDSQERYAGWLYLVAAHLGAFPLLMLFAGMGMETGSTEFAELVRQASGGWEAPGLFFLLALAGFGLKCGIVPLHVWMPEAYPSAPGHVSVVFSGAMLNLGLYGLLRVLTFLGTPEAWWAYALMGAGAFSGFLGILLALGQTDIRRSLAYSSVENMGIIFLALGAALLAALNGIASATAFLLAGLIFHMWNHSLFKSLLFLGINAVKESANATTLQRLGGLQKRMPVTGGCFAVGCAAIAGIPPLNGFMGEMLIYMGFAMGSSAMPGSWTALAFWAAFGVLGAIAGMALFVFTRIFGLAFLGAPRSPEVSQAKEHTGPIIAVMLMLAALCLTVSLAGPMLFRILAPFTDWLQGELMLSVPLGDAELLPGRSILFRYAVGAVLLFSVVGLVFWFRRKTVGQNGSDSGPTWDCGYRYPSARIQYTGGSFANSMALLLRFLMRPRIETPDIKAPFPVEPRATMTVPDWPTSLWDRLVFRPVDFLAEKAKNLQHGLVNIYILYILIALMTALIWALGWA